MNFSTFSRHFRSLAFLIKLKRQQWLDEDQLNKIQEQKLRRLIHYAYKNVPFYNSLFDSLGIKPNEIKKKADLHKIPILTKEDVKKNFPNYIVDKNANLANLSARSTTGSTGVPLKIFISPESEDYRNALFFFVFFEWGLRLKDKVMSVRHSPFFFNGSIIGKFGILNWRNISVFDSVESIGEKLIKHKPDVISTYPSMHLLLLEELKKHNDKYLKPSFITAHGETLTDRNRKKIMQLYNADIFTQYSTVETGSIAFECKQHSGLHIISDAAIIEIINRDQHVAEGEQGETVVTLLYNYCMPLIRYKLGDIATFTNKKCSCGRGYQLIKSIEGRTDDFFILPSGKKLSPRVINVIENIPGIVCYKTIQEAKNRIVVKFVKGKGFSKKTIPEIKKHIKAGCLGENVEVEAKVVDNIPLENRGKLRAVISKVKG